MTSDSTPLPKSGVALGAWYIRRNSTPYPDNIQGRFSVNHEGYSFRPDDIRLAQTTQGLSEKGIRPTIDVVDLEPGDDWGERLQGFIQQADVFYLMWSDHAAQSPNVEREARQAVTLHRDSPGAPKRPCIKPIPLEQPWPEPPDYLRPFQFYSNWQAHRVAQGLGLIKPNG